MLEEAERVKRENSVRTGGYEAFATAKDKVLWGVKHSISQENLDWYKYATGKDWSGGQYEWYCSNIARSSELYDVDRVKELYAEGWQRAEREEREKGALFYLRILLEKMNRGGEWYGTGFDKPRILVTQAIQILERGPHGT